MACRLNFLGGQNGHPVVAIHQPNYLPWLGYFAKVAQCDKFVFLDDVQFSKGSYTNRVKIASQTGARWLTLPVQVRLGNLIDEVRPSSGDWVSRHLDTLRGAYGSAPHFRGVFPELASILQEASEQDSLSEINIVIVTRLARRLGLQCEFIASSMLEAGGESDDRLVAIVRAISAEGTYLSGRGGASYQDPGKFAQAGLGFKYTTFVHPAYQQRRATEVLPFVAGLSIADTLFNVGWEGASELFRTEGQV